MEAGPSSAPSYYSAAVLPRYIENPPVTENTPLIKRDPIKSDYKAWQAVYVTILLFLFSFGLTIGSYLLYNEISKDLDPKKFSLVPMSSWSQNFSTSMNLTNLTLPVDTILLSVVKDRSCSFKKECVKVLRNLNNSSDLEYNFLFAADGRFYEERGWMFQSDCSACNNRTIHIALLGCENLRIKELVGDLLAFLDYYISDNKIKLCYEVLTQSLNKRFLIDVAFELERRNNQNRQCG